MILLKEYESEVEAERLAERLRAKGVIAHVSTVRSRRLGAFATGALKVGVWSVLGRQANDAVALLSNKRHKVESPLTEEEMIEIESKISSSGGALYDFAIVIVLIVSLFLLGSYVLLK